MADKEQMSLRDLIDAACCDALPEEWSAALERCLQTNPQARRQYFEAFAQTTAIRFWVKADRAARQALASTGTPQQMQMPLQSATVLGFLSNSVARCATRVSSPLVLAIALGTVVLSMILVTALRHEPRPVAVLEQPVTGSSSSPVARITDERHAQWNDASSTMAHKSLTAGAQLTLTSGSVEFTFESGATLTVEGPASVRLDSVNGGALDEGKAIANVPAKARGFVLVTPAIKVVDIGTRFGVQVDPLGGAEVHALQGIIEVASTERESTATTFRLTAGQAVRSRIGDAVLTKIDADPARFEPLTKPQLSASPLVTLVHYRMGEDDDPERPHLTLPTVGKLPLRASASIHYLAGPLPKASERAVSLRGDATEWYESNSPLLESAQNWVLEAWVRPRILKPATIVFNGRPEHEGFGLQIVDGKWAAACGNRDFLIARNSPCAVGEWTHLALVRNQDEGSQLWINGELAEVAYAEGLPEPDTGNLVIGGNPDDPGHSFDGDIDEVRWSKLPHSFDPSMLLRDP